MRYNIGMHSTLFDYLILQKIAVTAQTISDEMENFWSIDPDFGLILLNFV